MDLYTTKLLLEECRVLRQNVINLNIQVTALCHSFQKTNYLISEHLNEVISLIKECKSMMYRQQEASRHRRRHGRNQRDVHEVIIDYYQPTWPWY